MRKFICILTNIILSIIYLPISAFLSFLMWAAFSGSIANWTLTLEGIFNVVSGALLFLAPVFCILGIVLSVVKRKRECYGAAFLVQFLPVATTALGLFFLWII